MEKESTKSLPLVSSQLDGELRLDMTHRHLYATDASIYSELPLGVAFPANVKDVEHLVAYARQTKTPLIARTAGTSLAGQVVGSGLIVDFGRHLNAILSFDEESRTVRVEPGVIQDDLNRLMKPSGLVFGPDTSTGNRAMIGGMIGNNSCGARSPLYGTTRDHVLAVEVVLTDGTKTTLEDWHAEDLQERLKGDDRIGELLREMRRIVRSHRDLIAERFPKPEVTRRNAGYALDYLARTVLVDPEGEPLNLAKFLCGSEGTLALITEATLNCEPIPPASGVMVAHFETVRASLEATVMLTELGPSAVELVDKTLLDLTIDQLEHRHNRFFIQGDPGAILMIEFSGRDDDWVSERVEQAIAVLTKDDLSYSCSAIPRERTGRVWALRKAGLGLLMGMPGDSKPVAFVEDTAVAVADMPDYIGEFQEIMTRHGLDCVYYGHASVGELHLRPRLDLKQSRNVQKLKVVAAEVADLVSKYRGALSGEHGDGRARSPYLSRVMGTELTDCFREIKHLWDPDNLLNPGKIVDPLPVDLSLRTAVDVPTPEVETVFDYAPDDGLVRAVERCNGAGVCRKLDWAGGTMCPSYRATGEELHSTRGRANLMRTLLYEMDPKEALQSEELYASMELCLMCKGCKSECPASVDIGKLKAEFLQHYWDAHGVPLKVGSVGAFARMGRIGTLTPRLSNWFMGNQLTSSLLKRVLGMHQSRDLPRFAQQRVRKWFDGRSETSSEASRSVAVFLDEFTDTQDFEVGRSAVELLEGLGFKVSIPKHTDSGRPMISKGLLRKAAKKAKRNVEILWPLTEQDVPIIGLEPSATAALLDEYPALVAPDLREKAHAVAKSTVLLEDFLAAEHRKRDLSSFFDEESRKILLHGHCHQKALVGPGGAVEALSIPVGHEVELIDSGCCGMAGSFGYERDRYELSMAIGEARLFPAIRESEPTTIIAAGGTSCRQQIADGTGRKALHPAQILRRALRGSSIERQ